MLRKAEAMGLDVDEVDLYIDAQQQKVDQVIDAAAQKKRGASCPFCGGPVPQLTDKCPHCGENITVEASAEVKEIIDNLERALIEFKAGTDIKREKANVEMHIRRANLYYSNNPKIKKLLDEVTLELDAVHKLKKSELRKDKFVEVLKNNKKKVIFAAIVLIMLISAGVETIIDSFDPKRNENLCMEKVDEALKEGDLSKAEAYCTDFRGSSSRIESSIDKIVAIHKNKLDEIIETGDMKKAKTYLESLNIIQGSKSKYDGLYYKVINQYVKKKDLASAEELGMIWRKKIDDDFTWYKSSCYRLLKQTYAKSKRDFSMLKSMFDDDSDK